MQVFCTYSMVTFFSYFSFTPFSILSSQNSFKPDQRLLRANGCFFCTFFFFGHKCSCHFVKKLFPFFTLKLQMAVVESILVNISMEVSHCAIRLRQANKKWKKEEKGKVVKWEENNELNPCHDTRNHEANVFHKCEMVYWHLEKR